MGTPNEFKGLQCPPRRGALLLTTMLMAGRGSDADRPKVPAVQPPTPPPYSTFSQQPPTAPLVYPPTVPHHQPPPQTTSGYHVIPVGYQSHPYPTFVDGIPMAMRDPPLPFCGIGIGWALLQRETRTGCMYSCCGSGTHSSNPQRLQIPCVLVTFTL
ncbi:chitin-binding lectin 1 isoform X3 [Musa acuminata AAA Group]|uniref:chitin-binding lectin 1 isoform X3 n=1 Tax=Musa acuminata AAA Group TaxID=214697 RepID=UPI0031DFC9F2